jgi:predicted transcriptional regulator
VDSKLATWRAAAERGRVVAGFGDAAGRLYATTLAAFDKATQPYAASPLRVQRHKALRLLLGKGVQDLVRRQLGNLQQQGMKRFKAALLQHVALEDREDRENASQRGLEEWFASQAEKLVVPAVPGAGGYERALSEFVDQLTEYAHKWPQSPGYNVAAMKRMEAGARKKKGSGGKASWGATFQLVSLLRTPGDGALQGFATYQVRKEWGLAGGWWVD